jgi:hypothetical protein
MFRRALVTIAVVALVALTAGGCMDESPEQSANDLDDLQSRMVDRSREAVDAVTAAGLTVEEAAGVAEYCQMQPDPGVTYRTGARLAEGGDPADQVGAVRDVLVDLGWTVDTESAEADSPQPYANLTRDDLRASVSISRRQDQPGVTFGLTGPCLSVGDDFTLGDDPRRTDLLEG